MIEFLASNTLARLAVLAILFALVVLGVMYFAQKGRQRAGIRADLAEIRLGPAKAKNISLEERRSGAWSDLADRIERAGLNLADTKADTLRDRLRAAGYASPAAPKLFTLFRLVLVFVLPLVFLAFSSVGGAEYELTTTYLICAGLALAGLYLPNLVVAAKADRRKEAITHGFPDCLDLMLVCVEAGLGLEAAMDRVGREMVESHPLVSRLLSTATLQLRAGAAREDALRKMGEMSGVDEVRSFATLLIQSDKLGTSVADTLRVYAMEMREKRRLKAEEKAHRLPVLISIPLVVCMLPTMIGVLMMPGVIRALRQLLPSIAGG